MLGRGVRKPVLARVPPVMQGNTEHVEGTVRFTGRLLAVRCNGSVRFQNLPDFFQDAQAVFLAG